MSNTNLFYLVVFILAFQNKRLCLTLFCFEKHYLFIDGFKSTQNMYVISSSTYKKASADNILSVSFRRTNLDQLVNNLQQNTT